MFAGTESVLARGGGISCIGAERSCSIVVTVT